MPAAVTASDEPSRWLRLTIAGLTAATGARFSIYAPPLKRFGHAAQFGRLRLGLQPGGSSDLWCQAAQAIQQRQLVGPREVSGCPPAAPENGEPHQPRPRGPPTGPGSAGRTLESQQTVRVAVRNVRRIDLGQLVVTQLVRREPKSGAVLGDPVDDAHQLIHCAGAGAVPADAIFAPERAVELGPDLPQ